ncbi:MAG: hypothetical protein ABIL40_10095 [candidate division WOR-3 bacterium]
MLKLLFFLILISGQDSGILQERLGIIPLTYLKDNSLFMDFGLTFRVTYRSSFHWITEDTKVLTPGLFPEYIGINLPFKKTNTSVSPFYRYIYFWGFKDVSYLYDQSTGKITDTILWRKVGELHSYGFSLKQSLKKSTKVVVLLFQVWGKINEQLKRYAPLKLAYANTPVSGWGIKGILSFTLHKDIEVNLKGSYFSKVLGVKMPGGDTIIFMPPISLDTSIFFLPDTIENIMPYSLGIEIQKRFMDISGFVGIYYEVWERVSVYFKNSYAFSVGGVYQLSPCMTASLSLIYLTDYWHSGGLMSEKGLIYSLGIVKKISERISLSINGTAQKPYLTYEPLPDPKIRYEVSLETTIKLKN